MGLIGRIVQTHKFVRVPAMKAQGSGSTINMSSNYGQCGVGNRTPYASAKWAVIGFSKSLAIELGHYNIRCNAICPGDVKGAGIDRVIADEAELRGIPFEAVVKERVASQSL